tara:strand:- start:496 stop:759 length:264 start_codon:yes stop_codon:yes gene_type:complete
MLTSHKQILLAALGVLEQISTSSRTTRWVGTFNDFVTYDNSQTLTISMVQELLDAIKEGELHLPMSLIGGDTIYVDAEIYNWFGEHV